MGGKILAIKQMNALLSKLSTADDIIFLILYNLLRVRHGKNEIENNDKSINISEIKNKMLTYYEQLYNNFIKKSNKIFKSLSTN